MAVISVRTGATSAAIAGIFDSIAGTFVPTGTPVRAGESFAMIAASWGAITGNCAAIAGSCGVIIGNSGVTTEDRGATIPDPTA
jgi:hypothetical protein